MTDAELQAAAADLAVEVLLLDVPDPERPVPSGGTGYYWRVGEETIHDNDEPLELACRYFRDLWRRLQVERLVAERGLPAELVRATWDTLPYESVPFRLGWQRWRELREAASPRDARRRLMPRLATRNPVEQPIFNRLVDRSLGCRYR
jgi:hypothetical protein